MKSNFPGGSAELVRCWLFRTRSLCSPLWKSHVWLQLLQVCRFRNRKTLIFEEIIRENTLHSFGCSSKSSQPKLEILSATWSCDAPLENWHNEVRYLKSRFLVRPMRHPVSFFVFSKGQKRIHEQKSSRKSRFLETYYTKLFWFGFHYKKNDLVFITIQNHFDLEVVDAFIAMV